MTTGHFLSENSFILVVVFIKIEHIFIIFKYYSKAQRIKKKFSELPPPLKKKRQLTFWCIFFLDLPSWWSFYILRHIRITCRVIKFQQLNFGDSDWISLRWSPRFSFLIYSPGDSNTGCYVNLWGILIFIIWGCGGCGECPIYLPSEAEYYTISWLALASFTTKCRGREDQNLELC